MDKLNYSQITTTQTHTVSQNEDTQPRVPSTSVLDDKKQLAQRSCINLAWVSKWLDPKQEFLCGNTEHEVIEKIIDPIMAWTKENPETPLNFWYDQETITPQSLENTKKLLAEQGSFPNVTFRNYRDLKIIQKHPECFTTKIPLAFVVDFLRVIAAVELVNSKQTDAFIYADLDVHPINQDKLFDTPTTSLLKEWGIVHHRSSMTYVENSFFMLTHDPEALKGLEDVIISRNIKFVNDNLKKIGGIPSGREEQIYFCYRQLFPYIQYLKGNVELRVIKYEIYPPEKGEIYDPEKHKIDDLPSDRIQGVKKLSGCPEMPPIKKGIVAGLASGGYDKWDKKPQNLEEGK